MCVYCNISQKTSQRVKKLCKEQKSITLFHYYYYDLLQYTHSEKCNQFVLYNKNSNGLLKDYEFVKKEKQVCWRGIDAICVCVLYSNRSRSTTNENFVISVSRLRCWVYILIFFCFLSFCFFLVCFFRFRFVFCGYRGQRCAYSSGVEVLI